MRRARAERIALSHIEEEARAMGDHQSKVEHKNRFIQEVSEKLEVLHNLWKAAGFPFVPKRTYQPNILWELNGVEGGLSLFYRHIPGSSVAGETHHRLVMSKNGAAPHYIKEIPGSCRHRHNCPIGEVYEITSELYSDQDFCKNLDEFIEILTSFNQSAVNVADDQSQQ